MNLKTKAVGLLAGSALALSLASGGVAQTTDVILQDNPTGLCLLGAVDTLDADFGTFVWDGATYTGGTEVNLNVPLTQTIAAPTAECAIDVSASILTDTLTSETIPNASIAIDGGDKTDAPLNTSQVVTYADTGLSGTTQGLSLTLNPNSTNPAGTYNGTLTITLNNGG